MDLAVTNAGSANVSVFMNNGDGTFAVKVDYGTGSGPWSIFSSDLDGDGDMDFAVTDAFSGNVSILLNNNSSAVPVPDLPETYSMTVKSVAIGNKLEVRYTLPFRSCVKFNLYDIKGANVKKITEEKSAGFHSMEIDMKGRPKGVYFLKVEANGFTKTSKAVLM
jgi:hypothetical protein